MKAEWLKIFLVITILPFVLNACGGSGASDGDGGGNTGPTTPVRENNIAPIVTPIVSKASGRPGEAVYIYASYYDEEADRVQLDWTQTAGPDVILTPSADGRLWFMVPDTGVETADTLTFEVHGDDGYGGEDTKEVSFTALGSPASTTPSIILSNDDNWQQFRHGQMEVMDVTGVSLTPNAIYQGELDHVATDFYVDETASKLLWINQGYYPGDHLLKLQIDGETIYQIYSAAVPETLRASSSKVVTSLTTALLSLQVWYSSMSQFYFPPFYSDERDEWMSRIAALNTRITDALNKIGDDVWSEAELTYAASIIDANLSIGVELPSSLNVCEVVTGTPLQQVANFLSDNVEEEYLSERWSQVGDENNLERLLGLIFEARMAVPVTTFGVIGVADYLSICSGGNLFSRFGGLQFLSELDPADGVYEDLSFASAVVDSEPKSFYSYELFQFDETQEALVDELATLVLEYRDTLPLVLPVERGHHIEPVAVTPQLADGYPQELSCNFSQSVETLSVRVDVTCGASTYLPAPANFYLFEIDFYPVVSAYQTYELATILQETAPTQ